MAEARCTISVDGRPLAATVGESLAVALLRAGLTRFRESCSGQDRAPLCGMGTCYECLVLADGRRVRACLEPVRAGMEVLTHG
jgi:aerobic-type carbon monoxide dehydrogenase small subunit (CoxS/CutS family)